MDLNMTLRAFAPDDADAVADIAAAAWAPVYGQYRETLGDDIFDIVYPDWQPAKARQVREGCLRRPNNACVAECDGRVAAFITWRCCQETSVGEIGNNAVHPDFQGRGIAKAMYKYALEVFRKEGMRVAKVSTGGNETHIPARRAYEKAGFSIHIPTVTYYREL